MRHRRPGTEGNVSIFVAAVVVVTALLGMSVARLGGAVAEKSRANNAADASALAAADALARGQSPAEVFAAARSTAADNGARLVRCSCAGSAADVVVTLGDAQARARAEVSGGRAVRTAS